MKKGKFHFLASHKNLSEFPTYLAAAIELTVAIATLTEAAMCLYKPAEYANNLVKAGGNFTAHDLRNKTESILPSHVEAINASMTERDTEIEESQRFDPTTWLDIGVGEDLDDALDAICENAV